MTKCQLIEKYVWGETANYPDPWNKVTFWASAKCQLTPSPGDSDMLLMNHSTTLFSARLQTRRYSSVDIWNCHNCKVMVTLDGHHICELRIRKEISFQNINQKNSFQQEIFLALTRAAQEPELSQKLSAMDGESHPTPEMMTFCIPATRRHLHGDRLSRHRTGENTNTKRNSASGWMMIPFPCKWPKPEQ